jgi:hypothetical protein
LVERLKICVRQIKRASKRTKRVSHSETQIRLDRTSQNFANLGDGAAAMRGGSYPQSAMDIIWQATYG